MRNFQDKIEFLYSPYSSTLLSLSGGPDSVALFFLLLELTRKRPEFTFQAFYLSHNITGNEQHSKDAYHFVTQLCQSHNIFLHTREVDMGELKKNLSESIENLGRKLRYTYLRSIQKQENLETLSTGHHKDDLVESILMRLFQGVSPMSFMAIKQSSHNILRPLLPFCKTKILELLQKQGWEYIIDPSNEDTHYQRNDIRKNLIPTIQNSFPAFQDKLIQFGEILEEQNQWVLSQLPLWDRKEQESSILLEELLYLNPLLIKESIKSEVKYLNPNHYLTSKQLEYFKDYLLKYRSIYTGEKILYHKQNITIVKSKKQIICKKILFNEKEFSFF